jgi:peptidoglycan/xylan/chitin deacetylase (PgdA/CDA1 family)
MLQNNSAFQIPIFMYHHILSTSLKYRRTIFKSPYYISKDMFNRQLQLLSTNGYGVVTLEDALAMKFSLEMSLKDNVVISFDDGYLNNYDCAYPLLYNLQHRATFFVVSDWINSHKDCMTWNQLKEMANNGMEIGSHTKSHMALGECTEKETIEELESSKKTIEDRIGHEVKFLSFPHGSYNGKTLSIASKLGYRACCSSNWGYFTNFSNILSLERFAIKRNLSTNHFRAICENKKPFQFRMHLVNNFKRNVQRIIGVNNCNQIFDWIYKNSEIL